jgi:hypothetical protein
MMTLAHSFGHNIESFGEKALSAGGVIDLS